MAVDQVVLLSKILPSISVPVFVKSVVLFVKYLVGHGQSALPRSLPYEVSAFCRNISSGEEANKMSSFGPELRIKIDMIDKTNICLSF